MAFRSSLPVIATLILFTTTITTSGHVVFADEGSPRSVVVDSDSAESSSSHRPADTPERRTKFIDYDFEVCPEVETLHCKNGSTCTPGIASFGSRHDHLDLQTHENGYHCACPKGFIGHECDVEVDACELQKGQRQSCYNGSRCQQSGNGYYCDCTALNDSSASEAAKFEGLMCQHESTALCAVSLVGEIAPNHQFCTNHGTCVRFVSGGEPHPGCLCKDGYMGDHCEMRADPFAVSSRKSETGGLDRSDKILISSVVIGMFAIFAAGVGVFMWKAEKKKKRAAAGSSHVFKIAVPGEFQGETPALGNGKTVLDVGDLNPDGSATLGSAHGSKDGMDSEGAVDGDMELPENPGFQPEAEVV